MSEESPEGLDRSQQTAEYTPISPNNKISRREFGISTAKKAGGLAVAATIGGTALGVATEKLTGAFEHTQRQLDREKPGNQVDNSLPTPTQEKQIAPEEDREAELFVGTIKIKNRLEGYPEEVPLTFRTSPELDNGEDDGKSNIVNYDDFKSIYDVPVQGNEFAISFGEVEDLGTTPGSNPTGSSYDKSGGKWLKLKVEFKNGEVKDVFVNLSVETEEYIDYFPLHEDNTKIDAFMDTEIKNGQVFIKGSNEPEAFKPNQVSFEPTPETAQQ